MRIAYTTIAGVRYPAAFPLRAMCDLEDRSGKPATQALDEILSSGSLRDTVWLLAELLAMGARVTGSETPPPSEDQLLDSVGFDELPGLTAGLLDSLHTIEPTLHVESKNAQAT